LPVLRGLEVRVGSQGPSAAVTVAGRPETVRTSTPAEMSWVTMKWRRSCSPAVDPKPAGQLGEPMGYPSGRMGLEPSGARLNT
jgi:hypothetical protein